MQGRGPKRNLLTTGLLWLFVMLSLLGVYNLFMGGDQDGQTEELSQSQFFTQLENKKIDNIEIKPKAGAYEVKGEYRKDEKGEKVKAEDANKQPFTIFNHIIGDEANRYATFLLPNDSTLTRLTEAAAESGTKLTTLKQDNSGIWLNLLFTGLPLILFVGLIYFMTNRAQGGGRGNPMMMGKSNVKDQSQKTKVRFDDVAGAEEEKQELVEVVDFLKDPRKYHQLGARIPKGVLLEGPPGTGKTLLAKAVAGEARVPFYSISGSEFVEMFVGVGASRVRDLFETAKKHSPAIIFIDEIDAVGRRRGSGMGGGHDEREQTLNQLLVELDGFTEQDNVIVIAATNRSDVLDPALLRPGRFDRQVLVGRPDVKGREAILEVHARNKRLAADVDLKALAKQTPGFTGAELENVLNEAALLAARLDKKEVEMVDVDEAQDRVIAGPAKRDRQVSAKERRMVAFHEAGHTVCGLVLSEARVVHKVTIVPRGKAGGYAIMLPREDQMMYTKKDLDEQVVGLLGGRAAERVFFQTQTSGASNDFEQATQITRAMVAQFGMSEKLGPISYEGDHSMRGAGNPYQNKTYSEQTSWLIDQEVLKMMDAYMEQAIQILEEHREQVTLIAEKLLELETLDAKTIKSLFETGKMPAEAKEQEGQDDARPKSYEEVKAEMQRAGHKKQENTKAAHQGEHETKDQAEQSEPEASENPAADESEPAEDQQEEEDTSHDGKPE